MIQFIENSIFMAVSYTHLDVYKRQVLLLTCLGYHVNHLFPKDIPFDNSDKARSALAGMTIETTFGMQDSGRTLYLDLKDGEITQRYTRQSTQEKQKDYEISMERIFEMDEQTKKTIGKPKNLSEEGHEIKRVIPQADAAYVFYSSNNIKIPTQHVICLLYTSFDCYNICKRSQWL